MIAHIRGKVSEKLLSSLIIDVCGVGYEVQVTNHEFDNANIDDEIILHTYHHIREQSQELFGFYSLASKRLFEMLITVQGVGPKAALAILNIASLEDVQSAIASSDSAFITQASGVGKRTAERVVVDLSDKVGLPLLQPAQRAMGGKSSGDEALEALIALGYSLADASKALQTVDGDLPTAERIRLALKSKSEI